MGPSNFKRCLHFIKNLVRTFVISRQYTRFGAVLYNTRAYKIFGFNRFGGKNQVLRAVSRIRYIRGGTKTGRALSYAYRYLFRRSRRRKVSINRFFFCETREKRIAHRVPLLSSSSMPSSLLLSLRCNY